MSPPDVADGVSPPLDAPTGSDTVRHTDPDLATDRANDWTLLGLVVQLAEARPRQVLVRRREAGIWVEETAASLRDLTEQAGRLFAQLIQPGDRVGFVFVEPRFEWLVAELGVQAAGGISVGIHPSLPGDMVHHCLRDSAPRVVVVGDQRAAEVVTAAGLVDTSVEHVLVVDPAGMWSEIAGGQVASWADSLDQVGPATTMLQQLVGQPDDPVAIVYTAGTTGLPKGAVHTSRSLLAAAQALHGLLPRRALRYLTHLGPDAVIERLFTLYLPWLEGVVVHIAGSAIDTETARREIRPEVVVNRANEWEQLGRRAARTVRHLPPLRRRLLDWACHPADGSMGHFAVRFGRAVLRRLVLRPFLARSGLDRIVVAFGIGDLAPATRRLWRTLGIVVDDVYGSAECAVAMAGHDGVGFRPLPGVTIEVPDSGELVLTGAMLMDHYWGHESKRAATWASGDAVSVSHDGLVHVNGRIGECFAGDAGITWVPAMEAEVRGSRLVDRCLIYRGPHGDVVALVEVDPSEVGDSPPSEGTGVRSTSEVIASEAFRQRMASEIASLLAGSPALDCLTGVSIIPKSLRMEDWEVTTAGLRRDEVTDRFGALPFARLTKGSNHA